MKTLIILLFLFLIQLSSADDVYLKNGYVIRNVAVKDTTDNFVNLTSSSSTKRIPLAQLVKIVRLEIDPSEGPRMEKYDDNLAKSYLEETTKNAQSNRDNRDSLLNKNIIYRRYSYPNIKMLPISFVCLLLMYDNFDQVGKLNDAIDLANKNNQGSNIIIQVDNSPLEKEKTKRTILAVSFGILAIWNTVYSVEKVELKTGPDGVTLSYNF